MSGRPPLRRPCTDRGIGLLRSSLSLALVGHWTANLLFDADQYVGAGARVHEHLHDPILVQTAAVLVTVIGLAIWGRRRSSPTWLGRLGRGPLLGVLVAIQLLLFGFFEASERLAIDTAFLGSSTIGPFDAGLVTELVVALGAAIAVAAFGRATVLMIKRLRERAPGPVRGVHRWMPLSESRRRLPILAGAGGQRGPP